MYKSIIFYITSVNKIPYFTAATTLMKQAKIKVGIVDDHQIVIDGISSLLDGHNNISIESTNTSAIDMLKILEERDIDILLTDIMMPKMNGQELSKQVKLRHPHIKILALSMSGQGQTVNEMINDSDIAGYVLKNIGKQELIHAIEKIANGGIYFSEEVLPSITIWWSSTMPTLIFACFIRMVAAVN